MYYLSCSIEESLPKRQDLKEHIVIIEKVQGRIQIIWRNKENDSLGFGCHRTSKINENYWRILTVYSVKYIFAFQCVSVVFVGIKDPDNISPLSSPIVTF